MVKELRKKKKRLVSQQNSEKKSDSIFFINRLFSIPAPIAILSLFLLVLISYYPALHAGFVWDDGALTGAEQIKSLEGLRKIWFEPSSIKHEAHYWPLTYSSFWLEYQFWELNPFGYHLINILIHALNTIILWRLLLRLDVVGAWFIAALFAVHPTHVESVAWVIERKDVLSGLFYLTALWAYLRFENKKNSSFYYLALFLIVCGMLSKSIVVSFPVILLLLLWWKRNKISQTDLYSLIPFFVIPAIIAILDVIMARERVPIDLNFSIIDRFLISTRALCFYITKLLWPANQAIIYPRWEVGTFSLTSYFFPVAVLMILTTLWVSIKRVGKAPFVSVLFFIFTISPMLGFINYSYMKFSFVADRFQYLASIGIIGLVGSCFVIFLNNIPKSFVRWGFGTGGVVLICLGVLTWRQASVYKNQETLFRHITKLNPRAHSAFYNLGTDLMRQKRYNDAVIQLKEAIEINPDNYGAYQNMGIVMLKQKRYKEAIRSLKKALEIDPASSETYNSLGNAMTKQKQYKDAFKFYKKAIELNSNSSKPHNNLGILLIKQKKYKEAITPLKKAIEINPGYSNAHSNLGTALGQLKLYNEAITHYRKAIALEPNSRVALQNLQTVLQLSQNNK